MIEKCAYFRSDAWLALLIPDLDSRIYSLRKGPAKRAKIRKTEISITLLSKF